MLTNQDVFQLDADIRAVGIPIVGVSSADGSRDGIDIQFSETATQKNKDDAWAIVDSYFI